MLKSIRRTAAAVLYCASACSPAMASEAPPPILDIATYRSPSGEYALTVDPSQLHGQGAGSYRMTKNGKKIWSRELAFTLFEALVTNAGEVMGYAYTNGWRGLADQPNPERSLGSADELAGSGTAGVLTGSRPQDADAGGFGVSSARWTKAWMA